MQRVEGRRHDIVAVNSGSNAIEGETGLGHEHFCPAIQFHGPQGRLDHLVGSIADEHILWLKPIFSGQRAFSPDSLSGYLFTSERALIISSITRLEGGRGSRWMKGGPNPARPRTGPLSGRRIFFESKGLWKASSRRLYGPLYQIERIFCMRAKSSAVSPAPITIRLASSSAVRSDGPWESVS